LVTGVVTAFDDWLPFAESPNPDALDGQG
jgi:hypothetical protein